MAPRKQKAVFLDSVGSPVELGERDIPPPKAGEVMVKVNSTQLLPHDAYCRDRGIFIGHKLPFVLGSSIAGTVVEAGPDVNSFNSGDRVFGTSNLQHPTPDQAGLQEYAIL
ncbi:uncharacterized protein LTR77_005517 [Saxophila tyrrhenica]|uniref:Alcohol dehydrogenase-like N-terminal domain-containing protein n=1 Tax=Saxophila tyrrhenica TaxID=1690608 RepID=A0AAV9P8Z7_9PEZI|nr:hypothetical protein LTR77_005517 [Saxophila tyrrhenica]